MANELCSNMPDDARQAAEMAAQTVISALGDPVKHEAAVATIATFFESYAQSFAPASATRPAADPDGQSEAIDRLTAALASTRREVLEQTARADNAEAKLLASEAGKLHPAMAIDVQQHRNEAYQGGWDDGYAEGHAKALTSPARARGER